MRIAGETPKKRVGRNIKINGYSNKHRLAKKARKRAEAEERVAKWRALSPEEQMTYLTKFFPDGAKRQRARIEAQLTQAGYTLVELLIVIASVLFLVLIAFTIALVVVKALFMD